MTERLGLRLGYLECNACVFAQLANRMLKQQLRTKAAAVSARPQDK